MLKSKVLEYAAGECTGGIMKYYLGGGNSLLNCFVYGRIAGKNAADSAVRVGGG
ncbi:MAG: hypothetical protein OXC05_03240 [Halieaceae bacterium]|nr:hypothetical protein [Halieaceae bacterium]